MKLFKKRWPALIVTGLIFITTMIIMTPKMSANEFIPVIIPPVQENLVADIASHSIITDGYVGSTIFKGSDMIWSEPAPVSGFFDSQGLYNIVYEEQESATIAIARLNSFLDVKSTIRIERYVGQFGGAIIDENDNYYLIWGKRNETGNIDEPVLFVRKYTNSGIFLMDAVYTGRETGGENSGTEWPFFSGNCSLTVDRGVLVCHYARRMYDGHQSSSSLYIRCSDMAKLTRQTPYVSHSFDQQILVTRDNNFIFVDHGDAFSRGFCLTFSEGSILEDNFRLVTKVVPFHFREGSDRPYGYNETYAQLGGLAELNNSFVLVASSERTLSLDVAPTNKTYCGHSESRDLFIQYLRKPIQSFAGELDFRSFTSGGSSRIATGTPPAEPLTRLFLDADTKDFCVRWLTDYEDDYFAGNPKVITTSDDRVVVMWEKMKYQPDVTLDYADLFIESYYMILSAWAGFVSHLLSSQYTVTIKYIGFHATVNQKS